MNRRSFLKSVGVVLGASFAIPLLRRLSQEIGAVIGRRPPKIMMHIRMISNAGEVVEINEPITANTTEWSYIIPPGEWYIVEMVGRGVL